MASIEKTPVFYASFSVINTGVDIEGNETPLIQALVEQNYPTPILSSAQDYIVAVERFEINVNGVPFYDGTPDVLQVSDVGGGNFDTISLASIIAYSLPHMIDLLNDHFLAQADPRWQLIAVEITSDGFVIWNLADDNAATFKSQYLLNLTGALGMQRVFGLNTDDLTDDTTKTVTSLFPRWDCGDQLSYLRITSNLPTISDSVGQSKSNVLTDLYFGKNIGASAELRSGTTFDARSISYSQRQKIIYNPQERRFLNMRSSLPITDMRIGCEFVRQDQSSTLIPLPIGCEFTIKLGFWNLRNQATPRDTNFNSRVVGGQRLVQF